MSSSHNEEHHILDRVDHKLPIYSFTEAVRNLNLERLREPVASVSETMESFAGAKVDNGTQYEILQEYMEDRLEELYFMQIENSLEPPLSLANEQLLVDIEDELWDSAIENSVSVDYSGVDCNDYEYYDDVEYNSIDGFSPFERESCTSQHMNCYERSLPRRYLSEHSARMDHYEHHTRPMSQMVDSHLNGFAVNMEQDNFVGKRRLCRHFLKGRCNRGSSCDFLHDESVFCSDDQKVFLGGLPAKITDKALRDALMLQGYTVLNKPKVLQGFSPQVCLGSVQEAQTLIKRGKIVIGGAFVDVRPYEAFAKDNLKIGSEDEIKRSVFLGGLPSSTTGWMIKERLAKLGFETSKHPVVKSGFAPKVILESIEQARRLVKLKKVKINRSKVEVRPYSRYRM